MSTLSCAVADTLRERGGGKASPIERPLFNRVCELEGVGMGECDGSLLSTGRVPDVEASCGWGEVEEESWMEPMAVL